MNTQEECDYADKLNAAHAMLAALKKIDIVCNESRADLRKRMGTRVGNSMTIARAAIKQAEAAGLKAEG